MTWKTSLSHRVTERSASTNISPSQALLEVFGSRFVLNNFSFQPVLHDWCNKGRGMCYPVWDGSYKKNLAVNRKD